MADEKAKEPIIVLEPCTESVTALLAELRNRPTIEIVMAKTLEEAAQAVNQLMPCMVVGNIIDNSSVSNTVNLLKRIEKGRKYGLLKTMIVSKLKSQQLNALFTGLGVTDFIEEPIVARKMLFKANIQLKALESIRKKEEAKKASNEKTVWKKDKEAGEDSVAEVGTQKKPALELADDCFLFKNKDLKKVGKKVTVEVEGPPPEGGEWAQEELKPDGQSKWRWVPTDEDGKAIPNPTGEGWVYEGEKPQFKENTSKWQLQGEKPDLSFYKGKEKVASKLATKADGSLEIAEDSAKAEANLATLKTRAEKRKKKKAEKAAKAEEKKADEAPVEEEKDPVTGKAKRKISLKKSDGTPGTAEEIAPKAEKAAEATAPAPTNIKESSEEEKADWNGLKDKKKPPQKAKKEGEPEATEEEASEAEAKKEAPAQQNDASGALNLLKKRKERSIKMKKFEDSAAAVEEAEEKAAEKKESPVEAAEKTSAKTAKETTPAPVEETEEEEEEGDESTGKKPRKKISLKSKPKGAGEELSVDATPEEAREINDRTNNGEEKVKRELKKKLLAEIQEELGKPLEDVSDEELAATAKEEGLDPATPKAEIAKKRRLVKLKKLKEKLKDIEEAPASTAEEKSRELNAGDLSQEEVSERDASVGEGRREERKLNAFDSDEGNAENEEDEKLAAFKKKRLERAKKAARTYFYRSEDEIPSSNRSWEPTENYYVCISGDTRYHGFESIESLFPIWIYAGKEVPEFIAKEKRWRFADEDVKACNAVKDIPFEVLDYLNKINPTKQIEEEAREEAPESVEEKAQEEAPKPVETKKRKEASKSAEEKTRDETEEETRKEAPEPVVEKSDSSLDSLVSKSESVKKFLEARKDKQKNSVAKTPVKAEGNASLKRFLEISVVLSDAIYERKELYAMGDKLSVMLAEKMGQCFVYCIDIQNANAHVFGSTNPSLPNGSVYPKENLKNQNSEQRIIQEIKNSQEAIVGYIVLETKPERAELFNKSDLASVKKLADIFSRFWIARLKPNSTSSERKVA